MVLTTCKKMLLYKREVGFFSGQAEEMEAITAVSGQRKVSSDFWQCKAGLEARVKGHREGNSTLHAPLKLKERPERVRISVRIQIWMR